MADPAVDTEGEDDAVVELTGTQKSAILMMLLGEDEAAEILKNLSPREVQHLGGAMYSVQGVDQKTVNFVLDEFLTIIKQQTSIGLGAGNYIRNVLTKALGGDKAQSVLTEHPQIVALIVSYLDYGLAADVLGLLPIELQPEVVRRIATLETVQPEAVRELERVMQQKFQANTSLRASQIGGVKAAAKIMNFTKTAMEQRIMKDIKKENKDLMQSIQDNMFVFDSLVISDERSLQTLLRSIDAELLVLALKGADEVLREKLFSCMSTRAADNVKDEMEALGPVRLTEVQEAQKQIIAVARKMSDDGTIVLAGRGGDEMV